MLFPFALSVFQMKQYVTLEDGTCFSQAMADSLHAPCIPGEDGCILYLACMTVAIALLSFFSVVDHSGGFPGERALGHYRVVTITLTLVECVQIYCRTLE